MADSPFVNDVTLETFDREVLERSRQVPVLVDFWAGWCAPCKMLMPILAGLAEEYGGRFHLAKVDTDAEQELARRYGVRSLPTVMLFRDGEPVDEFMGALPESGVREFLDRHVENEADQLLDQARALREAGDDEGARKLLREALAAGLKSDKLRLELARLELAGGATERARELLDAMGRDARNDPAWQGLRAQLDFAELVRSAPDRATLEERVRRDPGDLEARYLLGARLLVEGVVEAAMEQFLEIVRRDRTFRDDAGRSALIRVFNLLGGGDPLVKRYRGELARLMY